VEQKKEHIRKINLPVDPAYNGSVSKQHQSRLSGKTHLPFAYFCFKDVRPQNEDNRPCPRILTGHCNVSK